MAEKRFRSRVYWLTFLFSLLVIWAHSFNAELFLGRSPQAALADRIERILGENLGQIAVPGFFMVSSYLFYRNFSWEKLLPKWRSRCKSLLIPYVLWNFLYYAAYILITRLPGISLVAGRQPVPWSWESLIDAVFFYTYNPVFWYLFQLILLVAMAPLIYCVMRWTVGGGGNLLFLAFCLWKGYSFPLVNLDALFFTCFAAWFSLHRESWARKIEEPWENRRISIAVFCFCLSLGVLLYLKLPGAPLWINPLGTVLVRLWGVSLTAFCVKNFPFPEAKEVMKHNFFLYAIHFAFVRLINKAAAFFLPPSLFLALVLFLSMPFFMVIISEVIGRGMRRFVPGLCRVLCGGR